MISYVLVLFESLTTGQLTHAYLQGPMSDSWCEQLIERDGYSGEDETSRRLPFCVSGPNARQMLLDYRCRPTRERTVPWRHHFDCDVPIAAPARAVIAPPAPSPMPLTAPSPPSDPRRRTQPTAAIASTSLPRAAAASRTELTSGPGTAARLPPEAPQPPQPQSEPQSLPEQPAPVQSFRPTQKQFHLGSATTALLDQAHGHVGHGNYESAAATIERAVQIEPENPLVWVELGRMRLRQGDAAQADAIERKALALAAGDSQVQASAWRVIAESLRVRGRNQEAAEADRTALTRSTQ